MKKLKRAVALILSLSMIFTLLAACDNAAIGTDQAAEDQIKLWYAYNTENLMQDLEYPELMESRDHTLRMYGVRNDAEPVQLMITPGVDITSYDITMADLRSEDGNIFAAENFAIFAQWYVEVTESYNNDAYYGFYPDALVPMENYKQLGYNFISAGKNQGLWVQANIPADQAAGFYTGSANLTVDGISYPIPIELTVYNAEIPVENHTPSSYGIWYQQIAYGEGFYSEELAQAYFDFLVERRTTPTDLLPSVTSDYDTYVEYVAENLAENPEITTYRLISEMSDYELGKIIDRDGVMEILTKLAEKNIELRQAGNENIDLFKKAYFYVIDEPTGNELQRAKDCDLVISECKLAVANQYFKDQYPDLYQSCVSVKHLVTTGYNPDLLGSDTVGGVQTWCPQFQHWHTEAQRQEYYNRMETTDREGGEEAWWYGCNNPKAPYPTYHLDDDLISSRVVFWMQHDYDVQGDLYYCVNMISGYAGYSNPWTTINYDNAANDGRLVYPGAKFGVFGPVSTMRMENVFQGREDYECLWQIEQAILTYNEENGTDYDPDELMDWLYDGLYNGTIPERDNAEGFAESRNEMLKILETIMADPAAGIAALEG